MDIIGYGKLHIYRLYIAMFSFSSLLVLFTGCSQDRN